MSDSINVRVTLDSYDVVHPSQKQTQVYVQIPEVGRASWLLDASFYAALRNEPWPHVIDEAHNDYMRRGVVSDSTSAAARQAIVDWLLLSEGADYDTRYDAVQAAWEADQARRHPVARKLLAENETLKARVTELESDLATANGVLEDVAEARRAGAVQALPWAHAMPDGDLSGFLNDLVSAAMGRWQSDPEVPDREVLAAVEKACAAWRTPGEGFRSDPEPDECPCPPADRPHQVGCFFDGVPVSPPSERPVVSSREEPHDSPLHHDWRIGHDLPSTGGAE
ncbi:hypothetical protein [Streptomyces turgidiscabies]|nr:hypothetical protein [Streptomyces turgidiscabies]